jgi:hypothetical protein
MQRHGRICGLADAASGHMRAGGARTQLSRWRREGVAGSIQRRCMVSSHRTLRIGRHLQGFATAAAGRSNKHHTIFGSKSPVADGGDRAKRPVKSRENLPGTVLDGFVGVLSASSVELDVR